MNAKPGLLALLSALFLAASTPVTAQNSEALTGTLKKVHENGTIIVGFRHTNVPFSYFDATLQPTGYTKELCDHIIDELKRTYQLPHLKTIYVPIVASERLSSLQNNGIDLVCGSSSISNERHKVIDFSIPFFVSSVRLLTRKDYRYKDLSSIKGKAIVSVEGTTLEDALRGSLDIKDNHIELLKAEGNIEAFLMVKSGRAAAYAQDDILLAALIANSRDPNAYELVGPNMRTDEFAIMMRKDRDFTRFVNTTIARLMRSGEFTKLYERWFLRPIPTNGIIMNLPMSEELSKIVDNPATIGP